MQRLQVSYEGSPSSVPEARHAVERALADWGLDGLAWAAALLVSELATNSLLHARTPFTVALEVLPGGGVRLEVTDGSAAVPRSRRYGDQATTGRGLRLVADLSRGWGIEPGSAGKTVWVELAPADDEGRTDLDADLDAGPDADAVLLTFPDLDGRADQDGPGEHGGRAPGSARLRAA